MALLPVVGVVTTSFPRYEGDAAGSFVFGMARALARRGYPVEVVAPEPAIAPDWTDGAAWLEGVRPFPAPYARPRSLAQLFYGAGVPDNLDRNRALAALIPGALLGLGAVAASRARRWDAVVSHWSLPSALLARAIRRRASRHLAICHSSDVHWMAALPGGRLLARAVVRSADRLGFVSERLQTAFLDLLDPVSAAGAARRAVVTPMGVDIADLASKRGREEIRQELGLRRFALLFLGRLVPVKGVDRLIDAVAPLEGIDLIVAGNGPLRGDLERRARALGAAVRFVGPVGPGRRAELLSACDAVAVPSVPLPDGREEGLPLVLVEALAAGKPVVASRCGAADEILEGGALGRLVPPGDIGALSRAIASTRAHPREAGRAAALGRERMRSRDWSVLTDRYVDLLAIGPTQERLS